MLLAEACDTGFEPLIRRDNAAPRRCRYLHRMELRRELYGRGGETATNRLEDQEATVPSLHLLQNCMAYVDTLMIRRALARTGAHWASRPGWPAWDPTSGAA